MILEIKRKDGSKEVVGGEFTFFSRFDQRTENSGKIVLAVIMPVSDKKETKVFKLKDYPAYNVGGTMVYCEEADDED